MGTNLKAMDINEQTDKERIQLLTEILSRIVAECENKEIVVEMDMEIKDITVVEVYRDEKGKTFSIVSLQNKEDVYQ